MLGNEDKQKFQQYDESVRCFTPILLENPTEELSRINTFNSEIKLKNLTDYHQIFGVSHNRIVVNSSE